MASIGQGSQGPSNKSMRNLIAGEGEEGPKLVGGAEPAKAQKIQAAVLQNSEAQSSGVSKKIKAQKGKEATAADDPLTILKNLLNAPEKLLWIVNFSNFDKLRNNAAFLEQLKAKLNGLKTSEKDLLLSSILASPASATAVFKLLELFHKCDFTFVDMLFGSDALAKRFVDLLFENPKFLLELLQNKAYGLDATPFDHEGFAQQLQLWASRGITSENEASFAASIQLLSKNYSLSSSVDFAKILLIPFILCDKPIASLAIAQLAAASYNKEQALEKAIGVDNVACFKKLFELWNSDPASNYATLLMKSYHLRAPLCLSYLLTCVNITKKSKDMLASAAVEGHAKIALAACENNAEEAANYLFSEVIPLLADMATNTEAIKAKIKELITKTLRFSPLDVTERIVQAFVNQHPSQRQILTEIYENTKADFLRVAPFISRHTKPMELFHIHKSYTSKSQDPDTVSKDLEYAIFCRQQVEGLLESLNLQTLTKPSFEPFTNLPPSSKGTKRVAALLEKISQIRAQKQEERTKPEKRSVATHFTKVREQSILTPVSYRYAWAMPLVNSVYYLSKAPDLLRGITSYTLSYTAKGLDLTELAFDQVNETRPDDLRRPEWSHGRQPVDKTWSSIEDLFEETMKLDVTKPRESTPQAIKKYQDQLTKLYTNACELVWLIGNTTPLERGSGTVAEWLFAIILLNHGLEPPLLKTEFPQLDVLDITFPLSDYKRFFPYFFEPSTIPEHLRRPTKPPQSSVATQMETLYTS